MIRPRITAIWLNSFCERFCIFAIFFNPFSNNFFLFFTHTSAFLSRSAFFSKFLILFWNIFFNIFYAFLVLEGFVLYPCFTHNLPIRINSFWNWFLLISVFLIGLATNLFLYWLAQFHYFGLYLAYLYYTQKKNFILRWQKKFLSIFYYKHFYSKIFL